MQVIKNNACGCFNKYWCNSDSESDGEWMNEWMFNDTPAQKNQISYWVSVKVLQMDNIKTC